MEAKEVIFSKVIEELKKKRKRDEEGVRLIGFLHHRLRRCESMS